MKGGPRTAPEKLKASHLSAARGSLGRIGLGKAHAVHAPVLAASLSEKQLAEGPFKEALLSYAIKWWTKHAREARDAAQDVLRIDRPFFASWKLFSRSHAPSYPSELLVEAWWYPYVCVTDDRLESLPHPNLPPDSLIMFAAFSGLPSLLNSLLRGMSSTEVLRTLSQSEFPHGNTVLMYAASGGYLDVVQLILHQCPNINVSAQDGSGDTALHLAGEVGHADVVEFLLRNRADTLVCNWDNSSAPMTAAYGGHVRVVQKYLEAGMDVNFRHGKHKRTLLHIAAYEAHVGLMRYLLDQHDADMEAVDWAGRTPLVLAVMTHKLDRVVETVKLLLERGARVNVANAHGLPLIEWPERSMTHACSTLREGITRLLRDSSGDPDARSARHFQDIEEWVLKLEFKGEKPTAEECSRSFQMVIQEIAHCKLPIQVAAFAGCVQEYEEWLPKASRVVDDILHGVPLHWHAAGAGWSRDMNILDRIMTAAGQIDVRDRCGKTPLHWACGGAGCLISILEELLDREAARPSSQSKKIDRLLLLGRLAQRHWDHDLQAHGIELLLEKGADINARDNAQLPPLFYAIKHYSRSAVEFLVAQGAEIDVGNPVGASSSPMIREALCLAIKERRLDDTIAKLLKKASRSRLDYLLLYSADPTTGRHVLVQQAMHGETAVFNALWKLNLVSSSVSNAMTAQLNLLGLGTTSHTDTGDLLSRLMRVADQVRGSVRGSRSASTNEEDSAFFNPHFVKQMYQVDVD